MGIGAARRSSSPKARFFDLSAKLPRGLARRSASRSTGSAADRDDRAGDRVPVVMTGYQWGRARVRRRRQRDGGALLRHLAWAGSRRRVYVISGLLAVGVRASSWRWCRGRARPTWRPATSSTSSPRPSSAAPASSGGRGSVVGAVLGRADLRRAAQRAAADSRRDVLRSADRRRRRHRHRRDGSDPGQARQPDEPEVDNVR